MAESKVKSHSRRTKAGQVRVKEGRRKSIGKKLAIGVGTGAALVGLGLAGKKLTKTIGERKTIKEIKDFKPNPDLPAKPNPYLSVEDIKRGEPIHSIYTGIVGYVINRSGKSEAVWSGSYNPLLDSQNTLKQTKWKNSSRIKNKVKISKRLELLNKSTEYKKPNDYSTYSHRRDASRYNSDKKQRKKAAKQLADAAKDLRSRGAYV